MHKLSWCQIFTLPHDVNNDICIKKHIHFALSSHILSNSWSKSKSFCSGPHVMAKTFEDDLKSFGILRGFYAMNYSEIIKWKFCGFRKII